MGISCIVKKNVKELTENVHLLYLVYNACGWYKN